MKGVSGPGATPALPPCAVGQPLRVSAFHAAAHMRIV
jgi:hypothetical protein